MKKSLVVLLIVVLAIGSAFAEISGSATAQYKVDFDGKAYGYTATQAPEFEFEVVADTKTTANEGDVYAKLAAKIKFSAFGEDRIAVDTGVAISEASINGANWSLNILEAKLQADYAKDVIDEIEDADEETVYYSYANKLASVAGATLTYDGYKVAAGINGTFKEISSAIFAVESKEFALSDAKAKAYVGFARNNFAASVKASYKDMVSVAADFGYNTVTEKFDFDAAVNAKYEFVTVDAYYGTVAKADDNPTITKLLSAKLVADLATAEVAPVKVTVTGNDVLNTKAFGASVETKAVADTVLTAYGKSILTTNQFGVKAVYSGVEKTTLTVDGSYAVKTKTTAVSAKAKYAADLFTATVAADFKKVDTADASLKLSASVESDALVSGATLTFAYNVSDVLAEKYGALTAKCEIEF